MYKMVDITQEFNGEKRIIASKELEINQPKLDLKVNKLRKCYQEEKWNRLQAIDKTGKKEAR